ncbi:conserved hypothetical protein [uncultured Paludibacter sp.]|uniref:Competence protein ComEA helix-hairpin-helix repeat protein n=1 Tax=uncultured Paludibacter sp. TaxID=497635 RepID=A0A653A9E7_9BACT|nr:conserved hypothetical protein [uncultured Paludibacter sp.]
MKWKDFFYFSKSQRTGIIVLLSLIFLTLIGGILLPYILPKKEIEIDDAFLSEAKKFKSTLKDKEPTWIDYKNKSYQNYSENNYNSYKNYDKDAHYELFTFDPNTTDSANFVKLGLKPYIAKNILKYRSKGGKFKSADDFAKVYGISSEKFEELKPYISIKEVEKIAEVKASETAAYNSNKTQNIVLELNSADTASLKQIKGIGTSFAKRIVGYRNVLGGYASVEQLKEVYGMKPEMYEQIRSSFTVNPSPIRKININTASIEKLKSHPYLRDFEKAKAVYEYRRKKIKLYSIDDLKVLDELNEEDLKKLEPYLEFK